MVSVCNPPYLMHTLPLTNVLLHVCLPTSAPTPEAYLKSNCFCASSCAAGSLAPFSKRAGEDSSMAMVPLDALAACDAATLNGVFLRSNRLDSE
eukprot:scaffold299314_cov17-Tisochrysis_lutea.AAC.1